jgi:alpha-tubulin suppressor-like RCC1 family protein
MSNVRISDLPVNQPIPSSLLPVEVMTSPGVYTTSRASLSTITQAAPNFTNFQSNFSTATALSAGWQTAYIVLCAYGPSWISNRTTTQANSSRWSSAYNTVTSFFPFWQDGYTFGTAAWSSVNANSAAWFGGSSAYTTVNAYSAAWQAAGGSGGGDSTTYLTVNALSADWVSTTGSVAALSARWSSVFTSVYPASGNWNSVYNYVYNTSATSNIDFNDTRYVNVTGDIISGSLSASTLSGVNIATNVNLSVGNNAIVGNNLTVTGSTILNGNIQLNGDIYNAGNDNIVHVNAGLSAVELYGVVNRLPYATGLITNHRTAGSDSNNYFIMRDGTVQAVGKNNNGVLGHGSTAATPVTKPSTFNPNLRPYEKVAQIYCQADTTFVITNSGAVYGAGQNSPAASKNLGLDGVDKYVFTVINGLSSANIVKLAVGTGSNSTSMTVLALTNEGKVWGWGDNSKGQLGLARGNVTAAANPLYISPLSTYEPLTDIAIVSNNTSQSSFVLNSNGTVYCCGYNGQGVLGIQIAAATPSTIWRPVTGLSAPVVKMIPVGSATTSSLIYYITENGGLSGAGINDANGQLGRPTPPASITLVSPVTSLSWGLTTKLPSIKFTGTFTPNSRYITNVPNTSNLTIGQGLCGFARVFTNNVVFSSVPGIGTLLTLVSTNPTTVEMNGTYPGTNTVTDPMIMIGGPLIPSSIQYQVVDIYPGNAASSTTYALVSTGTGNEVWGWGDNSNGQLGQNNAVTPLLTAVKVASNVKKFVVGGEAANITGLILTNTNILCAVGYGAYGQIGRPDNEPDDSYTPTPVLLPPDTLNNQIVDIAVTNRDLANTSTNCFALLDNGKVLAWGGNGLNGELGTDYRYSSYIYEYVPRYVRFPV